MRHRLPNLALRDANTHAPGGLTFVRLAKLVNTMKILAISDGKRYRAEIGRSVISDCSVWTIGNRYGNTSIRYRSKPYFPIWWQRASLSLTQKWKVTSIRRPENRKGRRDETPAGADTADIAARRCHAADAGRETREHHAVHSQQFDVRDRAERHDEGHLGTAIGPESTLYLESTDPVQALIMRQNLLQWDQALQLARNLAPEQVPYTSLEYANQLELMGQYAEALIHYERAAIDNQQQLPELTEHNNRCRSGVARTSLRVGDYRRGMSIASDPESTLSLKLQCAEILESVKKLSEAAILFDEAGEKNKAAAAYIGLKNWKKVGTLLNDVTDLKIFRQYAKVLRENQRLLVGFEILGDVEIGERGFAPLQGARPRRTVRGHRTGGDGRQRRGRATIVVVGRLLRTAGQPLVGRQVLLSRSPVPQGRPHKPQFCEIFASLTSFFNLSSSNSCFRRLEICCKSPKATPTIRRPSSWPSKSSARRTMTSWPISSSNCWSAIWTESPGWSGIGAISEFGPEDRSFLPGKTPGAEELKVPAQFWSPIEDDEICQHIYGGGTVFFNILTLLFNS
ncbi:unnamed protein product [Nesidiocoris tenuis]|uniref:Uncharacterized protein n=1 Tax=Nesidiocoris tenuis TaxID=355587 RepID=A0A6H5HI73_9HEMI|nr:unnamed protein product [Nesidiocoris tenuis]